MLFWQSETSSGKLRASRRRSSSWSCVPAGAFSALSGAAGAPPAASRRSAALMAFSSRSRVMKRRKSFDVSDAVR